jgi:DNA-binding protein HU-beta
MNKADLVFAVAEAGKISKATARKVVSAFFKEFSATLADRGKVTIAGFGTFSVVERSPRIGRNPRNGETVQIPSRNRVRFKSSRYLEEMLR